MTGSPRDVLDAWFTAHASGDLEAARALMTADATLDLPDGVRLTGFDAFMRWYAERARQQGPGFGYRVVDVLDGTDHAAAVLELSDGTKSWLQVALYRVEAGCIASVTAYEGTP